MNDDKDIKKLFDNFNPRLSADDDFMARLSRKLDEVEVVKQRNSAYSRFNRHAAVIATIAGFVSGVAASVVVPRLRVFFSVFFETGNIADISLPQFFSWLAVAGVAVVAALSTYEISLSSLGSSGSRF